MNDFSVNSVDIYQPTNKQLNTPYYRAYFNSIGGRVSDKDAVMVNPNARRSIILILIIVMMVAVIALYAVSFLGSLPFGLYQKIGPAPELIEEEDEELDQVNMVMVDDEEDDEAEEEEEIFQVGADDIVYSLLKSFSMEVPEDQELIFYRSALTNVDDVETPVMIGYYLVPVSIAISALTALFILIKAIIAMTSNKRRKFPYLSLILVLFTLLGVVGGFIWATQPTGELVNYLFMSGENLTLGLGLLIILGVEIVALVLSFFAYKSKKKCAPYLLFPDGSTIPLA